MEENPTKKTEQKNLPLPQKDLPAPEKLLRAPTFSEKYFTRRWLILSLAILLILGFLGFFFVNNALYPPQTDTTPTPDPIAEWQTYNSELLGFSIKYPPSLKMTIPEESIGPVKQILLSDMEVNANGQVADNDILLSDPGFKGIGSKLIYKGFLLSILASSNPSNQSSIDNLSKLENEGWSVISIDDGIGYRSDASVEEEDLRGKTIKMNLVKNDKIYTIQTSYNGNISTYETLFNDILSTFKFLDSQSTPTSPPSQSEEPVFCTQEAKLCSDGSYVGRTGPNCEFAPCPN